VQSEEGKGSTFTLYFPVTREDITAEASTVALSAYIGKGESILIVDHENEQRDLAASLPTTLNYNVQRLQRQRGGDVLKKEHKVDLMVLDMITDPGMDGRILTSKSLESSRSGRRLP